jgi:hypothetical protein
MNTTRPAETLNMYNNSERDDLNIRFDHLYLISLQVPNRQTARYQQLEPANEMLKGLQAQSSSGFVDLDLLPESLRRDSSRHLSICDNTSTLALKRGMSAEDIQLIKKIIAEFEEIYGVDTARRNDAPYPFRGSTLVPVHWSYQTLFDFVLTR